VVADAATPQALERLALLKEAYKRSKFDYQNHATRIYKEEWVGAASLSKFKEVVEASDYIHQIPDGRITRQQVFTAFQAIRGGAHESSPPSLKAAFVAVMAWGFRPRSYGPWRTNEMLGTPGFVEILKDTWSTLSSDDGGPLKGYEQLSRKINRLGPAFATKFLYFASPPSNRAPILDAVVARWLWLYGVRTTRGGWLNPVPWNSKVYGRYIEFCDEVAEPLGIHDRGLVEYLIFADAQYADHLESRKQQPIWLSDSHLGGWPEPH
jgi:hypothetical protein